jgi:hypothetical protein
MNSFKESFKSWFGYSRRERRSTFILLNIIVLLIGVRYFYPVHEQVLKELPLDFMEVNNEGNLLLQDTQHIRQQKEPVSRSSKRALLNLNSCDSASLEALPGIGPVLSSRILKYRNLIGGYISADQLREVYGLSEETFDLISARVWADSLSVKKIRINKDDYRKMARHPYFQKGEVTAILKYRDIKGHISGIGEMVENNLISQATAKKIGPYLEFGE